MKDKDLEPRFPWTIALITSGICYLAFSGFMELLNNHFPAIFMWIGMISMSLGCLMAIGSVFLDKENESDDQFSSAENSF